MAVMAPETRKTTVKPGPNLGRTTTARPAPVAKPTSTGVKPGPHLVRSPALKDNPVKKRKQSGRPYRFRNLPQSASVDGWAVCGDYEGREPHPYDVLEWCTNEADAYERQRAMEGFKGFSNLYTYRW